MPVSYGWFRGSPIDRFSFHRSSSKTLCLDSFISTYAYFRQSQRLAILHNGKIRLYNTLNHQITGVRQQQGGYSGSLMFSSQYGTFGIDTLESPGGGKPVVEPAAPANETAEAAAAPVAISRQDSGSSLQSHDDILKAIERIADPHQKGILSDDEFKSKKAELLSRL
jgi:hypothetical protein